MSLNTAKHGRMVFHETEQQNQTQLEFCKVMFRSHSREEKKKAISRTVRDDFTATEHIKLGLDPYNTKLRSKYLHCVCDLNYFQSV